MVGADHELGGDRGAVGAGPQVGDVALQPGQGPGLVLQFAVDGAGAAGQLDEPVPLHRGLPGDGLLGLGDLLVDAAQRAAGPVGLVLVVDDLVAAAAVRPGGPGLGEDLPVGDVLAGVLAPPLRDQVGDVRDLRAEDERQARGLDLPSGSPRDTMPASATTVTSGSWCAAMNASITGSIVLVSALLPSNARHHEREPVGAGEQADGDLRFQPPLLGEPALPEPVTRVGLEIQGGARRRGPGSPGPARRARRTPRRSAAARSPSRTRAAAA